MTDYNLSQNSVLNEELHVLVGDLVLIDGLAPGKQKGKNIPNIFYSLSENDQGPVS